MGAVGAGVELEPAPTQALQSRIRHAGNGVIEAIAIDIHPGPERRLGQPEAVAESRLPGGGGDEDAELAAGEPGWPGGVRGPQRSGGGPGGATPDGEPQ